MINTYQNIADHMIEVVKGCGRLILQAGEEQIQARTKTSFRDLVTRYDVQVQKYAIDNLKERFPDAGFISEESDPACPDDAALTFVIDPIDGTANFVHHFHHSCTSIACVQKGETIVAVVFNPYRDELFHAVKGAGAFLNGEQLHMEERTLAQSLVLVGSAPYNPELTEDTFRYIRTVFGRCQDIRRSGSAALDLCDVAAGRGGLFFEPILSVWDYAAGMLIVTEAGGACTSLSGEKLIVDRPVKSSVIAGGRNIIEESGLTA